MQEDELYLFTKEVIDSLFGGKESIANIEEISEAYSLIPGNDEISAKARHFFMIEVNEKKRVNDSAMMGDHGLSKEECVEIRKKIDLAKEKHKTGDYEVSDELKCIILKCIIKEMIVIKKRNIEWDNRLNPPVKLGENRISPNWCVHCGAATYSIDTNTSDCDCRFQRYNPDINKLHVCNVCANYHINGKQSGFARTYNLFYGGRCPGEFLFCNNTL